MNASQIQAFKLYQDVFNSRKHLLEMLEDRGYNIEDFPVAYDNYSREISLPIYPQLADDEVDYVCTAILTSYKKVIQNND